MRFFIDENINHHLARALNHLSKGIDKDHCVIPCQDKFARGTPDIDWLSALGHEGDWLIITRDRLKKGEPEKFAFTQAKLTTFNLTRQWKKKSWEINIQLIRWWPHILQYAQSSHPGTLYEVPWQVGTGTLSRF